MTWKDSSGNERVETWKLTKDKLLDKPLAFTNSDSLLKTLTAGILLAIGITGSYFGLHGLYYAAMIPFIRMPNTALLNNLQSWFNRLVKSIFTGKGNSKEKILSEETKPFGYFQDFVPIDTSAHKKLYTGMDSKLLEKFNDTMRELQELGRSL
jgi:hypothetical protein